MVNLWTMVSGMLGAVVVASMIGLRRPGMRPYERSLLYAVGGMVLLAELILTLVLQSTSHAGEYVVGQWVGALVALTILSRFIRAHRLFTSAYLTPHQAFKLARMIAFYYDSGDPASAFVLELHTSGALNRLIFETTTPEKKWSYLVATNHTAGRVFDYVSRGMTGMGASVNDLARLRGVKLSRRGGKSKWHSQLF